MSVPSSRILFCSGGAPLMEIVGVYGDSLRDMANEMFGDGIMSAIDFTLDMEKVTGSQGEARVKITMNGKWLPYKEF